MKINAGEIKVGMLLEYKNDLWQVLKTQHVKPGKGGAFAQVEMKSLNKSTKLNERFRSNESVEKASLEDVTYNYLYSDEEKLFFIEPKSFEQIELAKNLVGEKSKLLMENLEVTISFYNDKPVSLELPKNITCIIKTTDAALKGQTMEVYDSFDRANFKVKVSDFFGSGSYISQNTIQNHLARLQPKQKKENSFKNFHGNFNVEYEGDYLKSSLFQTSGDFIALGYNQSTNNFENSIDPLSSFFNDSQFGNKYLVNPYFYVGSGEDYFMSFNPNNSFGIDTFTNQNSSDYGFSLNFNPVASGGNNNGVENLQFILGTNYEENKFLNSTSSGVFATGDMSNTNFTGLKYKKNISDELTFIGSGFAGYTYIDKAANSYINSSTPILTSSFTLGLAKSNFIKEKQNIGFFINQPQRVENGNINLRLPTSSDRDRTVTYSNLNVDLEPDARQINFDILFNKIITESSNLSANLTHVQNGDHSNGSKNQNFISLFYKKTF